MEGLPAWALAIGGPLLVHLALFWALVPLFHYADTHDRPAWIVRHRIQSAPLRRPAFRAAVPLVLVNQLFWSPLLLGALWLWLDARGWSPSPTLPGPGQLALELLAMGACSVIWFYASHRFLHRPWWMKRVHRVHHEFRATTALASEYAHPVEFVFGSFGTLAAGVAIFAPDLASILLYTALSIWTVLIHHCGYALPWAPWSVHHDWHHYKVAEAFGTLGILDRLLGTQPRLDALRQSAAGDQSL